MSFKSFLSAAGHDFVSVFTFLGSAKGQAAITGAESIATVVGTAVNPAVGAGIAGVSALVNAGLHSALSIEASAAAVGAQNGTGTQKAAAVTASLSAQVGTFLQSIGVSNPTVAQVQALSTVIGTSMANIMNAIPSTPVIENAVPAAK